MASPFQRLRRFTRSLLVKDKDKNDDDLSGTTTASNASSSPSPNTTTTTSTSSNNRNKNTNKIPTNLRELLATGLLEGQPVKYIMRKGKFIVKDIRMYDQDKVVEAALNSRIQRLEQRLMEIDPHVVPVSLGDMLIRI
ncbi:unnamed protein product [Miscanthus lutarioriparius]|uniref:Uncharacterized protein n=1 Tax=Miscanthus lutarioriparius TaxID=422564 RepID=A0A811NWP2_9POAL|nr:unnamed protein product [Miscanthus lutarioriparius]